MSDPRKEIRTVVRQVSKSRVDLEITPLMKIGVYVYIKTKSVSLPTVKKCDSSSQGPVRLERTYSRIDDPDIVVDNKMMALRYGGEYVAIADKDALKFESEKNLRVIGFFEKSVFHPHFFMGNTDCVAAEPGNINAAIALSSLIHGLVEMEKVALCRFSFRANAEPKLVVLIPHFEKDFECFYAIQVPFAEDSRENSLIFPPLPEPTSELTSVLDKLIDERTIPPLKLLPELVLNPVLARFWATVDARRSNPEAPVAPLDMEQSIYPEEYIFDNEVEFEKTALKVQKIAGGLLEVFDDEEAKKKKRYWREIQEKAFLESPKKGIDVKKIRTE